MATIVAERFQHYADLIRIRRPVGVFLLIWPFLWALWIVSAGKPNLLVLIVFLIGAVIMRSAGCVINDFADRHIDGHVSRTKNRPLASGKITEKEALILFCLLCSMAFSLVLLLNRFTVLLSFVGVTLVSMYPFMKRYTYFPQLFWGFSNAWAVPMVVAAQTDHLPPVTWLIYSIAVIWAVAFDTVYAMTDREDDLRIGVKSTAIKFGQYDKMIIGALQLIVLTLLIILGRLLSLSFWYYLSVLIASSFFVYQQYLIKDRIPQRCFKAFLSNNWFGCAIFMGFFLHYWTK